ncbi:hypothetical protein C6A37_07325 [Desulfobacteraceae bacterium SEEP-SAG9]|nr:hypothetical protein C6A37_07325 [Desulfobacteraceae bacterium SEEP-SAG9]
MVSFKKKQNLKGLRQLGKKIIVYVKAGRWMGKNFHITFLALLRALKNAHNRFRKFMGKPIFDILSEESVAAIFGEENPEKLLS